MRSWGVLSILLLIAVAGCASGGTSGTPSGKRGENGEYEPKELTKDYTFIQVITLKEEGTTRIITKNKITKTATVEMTVFYNTSELKAELPFGRTADLTNLTTTLSCGLFSKIFFNQTALEVLKEHLKKWSVGQTNIEDDSPPEQKEEAPLETLENQLEGYRTTKVQYYLRDKSTNNLISECSITGPNAEDIEIKIHQ